MDALLRLSDKLPTTAEIAAHPDTTRLPTDAAAHFILAFALAQEARPENLTAFMTYVSRWATFEAVVLFVTALAGNRAKAPMACANAAFRKKASELGRFF
jgi:hypothetical protein